MPWLLFTSDFDFVPPEKPMVCVSYKRGMVQFVRRICATIALAQGKAVAAERPNAIGQ